MSIRRSPWEEEPTFTSRLRRRWTADGDIEGQTHLSFFADGVRMEVGARIRGELMAVDMATHQDVLGVSGDDVFERARAMEQAIVNGLTSPGR